MGSPPRAIAGSTPPSTFTLRGMHKDNSNKIKDKQMSEVNGSFEVPATPGRGSNVRAKAGQAAQVAGEYSESWIVNAAAASPVVGDAVLSFFKRSFQTRGAFTFGTACILVGAFHVTGSLWHMGMGALSAGSDRPLPQDANTFVRLGRTTARTGGNIARAVATGVSEGVAAGAYATEDRQYASQQAPRRVTTVNNSRRAEAYRHRR